MNTSLSGLSIPDAYCYPRISPLVLNDYTSQLKLELYGRGETMVQIGVGAEGDDGDGEFHFLC